MSFPANFIWGTATASYQIEGAAYEDGRGLSVWDTFCKKPGAVWGGASGDEACDHYHRYPEDIALMKMLGAPAYRLSIAWPRIMPTGTGAVNSKGLAFYDKLIDGLLAAGITPYVTLFHWDFPYELYCRGGWLNRDSADWFADYTAVVVDKLSDRVHHWMTHNEPQCFIGIGHLEGRHAPGDKLGQAQVLRAAHHALLSHGKSAQVIRARSKTACQIGYASASDMKVPATASAADIAAARLATFAVTPNATNAPFYNNAFWLDPLFLGHYPEDGLQLYGQMLPIQDGDMETIYQPLDFLGINIYTATIIRAGQDQQPEVVPYPHGHTLLKTFRWHIAPSALYWGPKFLYERYHQPVIITENGLPNIDWVALDGKVHDPQRIDYLNRHLQEVHRAIQDGTDIRGYFHWSLLDNFEWAEGYKERFGLIYVDYQTQQRIPKDSAYWYQAICASNGENLLDK